MERKKILRTVDANFNRCKEGLRVIEDSFRFICKDNALRRKIRTIRHSLDFILDDKMFIKELLRVRNTQTDFGKGTDKLEMRRQNVFDIVYANFQRAKESARVLEELFKILDKTKVRRLKKIRYDIYSAEKKAFKNGTSLYNHR